MVNLGLSSYLLQSRSCRAGTAHRLGPTGRATPPAAEEAIQHGHPSLARTEHHVQKWVTGPHRETLTFSTCEYLLALLCSLLYLLCVGQVSFVRWFWQVAHGIREVRCLGVHGLILPLCPTAGDICSLEGILVVITNNKLVPDLP